ncbi:indole-3-glycerol phosphate synthase TrpC [Ruficoccus sp. ZRK36]|uniref:indole-3-glycerol phosphate synthase TrpC n=1 Tax=Ruficoccus sp. ZRK36 TaxID=2866311 RepID=UPI001C73464E|nr:indole-3-glycerol phosphate synthase TrpC [Ruficoccus sp. ZRK36]QYY36104.1 indole-3-glycerol phosphate synthase TrpC [Ruficoccus sp. ZRK36]
MDKLTEIMAHKREEIAPRLRPVSDAELARFGDRAPSGPGFIEALAEAPGLGVIAEIKRRSPSAGQIAELPAAEEQARKYLNAEADAISVLTDEKYFGGTLKDLWAVTDFIGDHRRSTPCLRKDFMVHPLQVLEAAEAGARCILIIVRALKDDEIKRLRDAADIAGLDILYEIHTEPELERALRFGPEMIGVNNRDLARFRTDLAFSEKLIPQIPDNILAVSESGIFTPEDGYRVFEAGAKAVLIGEALMKLDEPEELVEALHNAG